MKVISVVPCYLLAMWWSFGFAQSVSESDLLLPDQEFQDSIRSVILLYPEQTQLAVALIKEDQCKYVGVIRQMDSVTSVTNHQAVFEIGSVSKIFTAVLLSILDSMKVVRVEDPIQDYLDLDWKIASPIRFYHLANHTSGLPRLPSNLNLFTADPKNPYKNYDKELLTSYLTEHAQLSGPPGTNFEYSNLGSGLLGYLLGHIAGSNYETLLQDLIFSRWGMTHSTTDPMNIQTELIRGIDGKGDPTPNWDFNILVGAGGILSTVEDLARFVIAHFNPANQVLHTTLKSTFSIHDYLKIGLGWHILTKGGGTEVAWHNGATGGYTASLSLDVDKKIGVVILSNVSGFNSRMREIDNLCFRLMKMME